MNVYMIPHGCGLSIINLSTKILIFKNLIFKYFNIYNILVLIFYLYYCLYFLFNVFKKFKKLTLWSALRFVQNRSQRKSIKWSLWNKVWSNLGI